MCEVAPMAGNQAVDDANLFTTPEKLFCKVGTDEARATRDEV
jgi:streptomycin 6-kinase